MFTVIRENLLLQIDERLSLWLRRLRKESSAEYGLTGTQFFLLRTLVENGGCTVSDLAEHLGVTPSSVTGLTDRLTKNELVTRQRDKADRRIVRIQTTVKGDAMIGKVNQRRRELMEAYFTRLKDAELEELIRLLGGIG